MLGQERYRDSSPFPAYIRNPPVARDHLDAIAGQLAVLVVLEQIGTHHRGDGAERVVFGIAECIGCGTGTARGYNPKCPQVLQIVVRLVQRFDNRITVIGQNIIQQRRRGFVRDQDPGLRQQPAIVVGAQHRPHHVRRQPFDLGRTTDHDITLEIGVQRKRHAPHGPVRVATGFSLGDTANVPTAIRLSRSPGDAIEQIAQALRDRLRRCADRRRSHIAHPIHVVDGDVRRLVV